MILLNIVDLVPTIDNFRRNQLQLRTHDYHYFTSQVLHEQIRETLIPSHLLQIKSLLVA